MLALVVTVALAQAEAVDTKPVAVPPVETQSVETKPVETKPVETKPVETKPMKELMHTYVRGERWCAIPFAATAIATGVSASLFVGGPSDLGRGAGIPLLSVAVLELAFSAVIFGRSFALERRLDEELAADPKKFAEAERVHAGRIAHTYQPLLLSFEAAIAVTGGALAGAGAAVHNDRIEGVGIGLLVQGLALFLLDWAVLDRALAYETAVKELLP